MSILNHAVPEDSPTNIKVIGNNPSSVTISWIPPSIPNGIITNYNLYLNYNDGSEVSVVESAAPSTNYIVTSLEPYQLISVAISASTIAGEGPLSDVYKGRAEEEGKLY